MALVENVVPKNLLLQECWELLRQKVAPRLHRRVLSQTPEESFGLVLATDVLAERNVPHFSASAVDGYTICSDDAAGASPSSPVLLPKERVRWCNTGNPISPEYDAVIMVEDTSETAEGILLYRALPPGTNVRPVGEDATKGRVLVHRGERLTPARGALCVAAGVAQIAVYASIRVTYVPTGDEIVSPTTWLTEEPKIGVVGDTNSLLVKGYLTRWGVTMITHPVVPDDPEMLREVLHQVTADSDIVLLGAGTAKGHRDHSAEVLASLGQQIFHGLRMRPGRPAMMGMVNDTPVLCLPGFPLSAAVTLWSLFFPLLRLYQENAFSEETILAEALDSVEEPLVLLMPHSSPQGVEEWVRLRAVDIDGIRYGWAGTAGASALHSLAESDGMAFLGADVLEMPKGAPVVMWRTHEIPWKQRLLLQGSDDPGLDALLSPLRDLGGDMIVRSVGSLGGLAALRRGEGHGATCHLLDDATGTYNDTAIAALQNEPWDRFLLYWRTQGLIVARGNPKNIQSIQDLNRKDLVLANRQPGAGTRVLLDALLRREGIIPTELRGYDVQCSTHLEGAARVAAGTADVFLGIRAAASALDLDFIPLTEEPFEIVIPARFQTHPGIIALHRAIESSAWRTAVERLGGYRWPSS